MSSDSGPPAVAGKTNTLMFAWENTATRQCIHPRRRAAHRDIHPLPYTRTIPSHRITVRGIFRPEASPCRRPTVESRLNVSSTPTIACPSASCGLNGCELTSRNRCVDAVVYQNPALNDSGDGRQTHELPRRFAKINQALHRTHGSTFGTRHSAAAPRVTLLLARYNNAEMAVRSENTEPE